MEDKTKTDSTAVYDFYKPNSSQTPYNNVMRFKTSADETKAKVGYPVQESLGASGSFGSYEQGDSSLLLHSGFQSDIQQLRGSTGSMGDSGFYSQTSGDSFGMKPKTSLSSAFHNVSIKSRIIDPENCYRMDHPRRGHCLIINNTEFKKETKMGSRKGSDIDAANMYRVFNQLGFKVELKNNQTVVQMMQLVDGISKLSHADCDCFAMVILSHGDVGIVYGTDGFMKLESLVAPLKGNGCLSLAGKPKLVFIQACRGTAFDEGVDVTDALPDDESEKKPVHKIPSEADFLFAFSSPPGYYSFRNNTKGSWFVQALTKVFEKDGEDLEIMQWLTRTNRLVAQDFVSCSKTKEVSGKKQVPSIVSMLTKELYFGKK